MFGKEQFPLGVPEMLVSNPQVVVPGCIAAWLVVHMGVSSLLPEMPSPHARFAWANRITSLLHGVVAASLAVPFTLQLESFPTPIGSRNSALATMILQMAFGYFAMDLGMGTLGSVSDLAVMLHHVACMVGIGYSLVANHSGAELVTAIALGELTIPPFCVRWMLRRSGLVSRLFRIYVANEIIFFLSFLINRLCLGIPFTLYIVASPDGHILIKICAIIISIISLLWFSIIASRTGRNVSSYIIHGEWDDLPVPTTHTSSTKSKSSTKTPQNTKTTSPNQDS